MTITRRAALALPLSPLAALPARAQPAWPSQPIRISGKVAALLPTCP